MTTSPSEEIHGPLPVKIYRDDLWLQTQSLPYMVQNNIKKQPAAGARNAWIHTFATHAHHWKRLKKCVGRKAMNDSALRYKLKADNKAMKRSERGVWMPALFTWRCGFRYRPVHATCLPDAMPSALALPFSCHRAALCEQPICLWSVTIYGVWRDRKAQSKSSPPRNLWTAPDEGNCQSRYAHATF